MTSGVLAVTTTLKTVKLDAADVHTSYAMGVKAPTPAFKLQPTCLILGPLFALSATWMLTGNVPPTFGQPVSNMIRNIHQQNFCFFQGISMPGVALVVIKIVDGSDELSLPFVLTEAKISGYTFDTLTAEHVVKKGLKFSPSDPTVIQPLVKHTMILDMETTQKRDKFTKSWSVLCEAIDSMNVTHVIIFFVTHADPTHGNLHFMKDGAAPFLEVFPAVFSAETLSWLKLKETTLFYLVCGSRKGLTHSAYNYIKSNVAFGSFKDFYAYPTPHLQPRKVADFIADYIEQFFFVGGKVDTGIFHLLDESPACN
ncbi:hypothetical protein VKT23_015980 [Stygiomarasmius scandens]|uniref:Uncharacterized protein n=1 Tax=Marasmiellus scandens TaxID=2682957 RepID=A0ABR1J0H3_9AGAR